VLLDAVASGQLEVVTPADTDDEARKVTQALTNWPFGGADDETVRAVAQAAPPAAPAPAAPAPSTPPAAAAASASPAAAAPAAAAAPSTTPAPSADDEARRGRIAAQYAALETTDGLGIPNQRSAAFNPLEVTPTPPPNRYLQATRRQQANFGSTRFELEESGVAADCG
jgi:hypothetical protein